jgi:hypothetical protein
MQMPIIPESCSVADWKLMVEKIGLQEVLSKDFSSTYKDEEWLNRFAPGMSAGWFSSPKGIFIVRRPYFTAINRKKLETLCETQETFNRVVPMVVFLLWKSLRNIADKTLAPGQSKEEAP